jgi:hypothetical protein
VSETKRYRKTARVAIEQIPEGEVRTIDTWEGPATATYPQYQVWALTENGDSWPVSEEFFSGENGYDETGEVVDGKKVYRKKASADVLAYQVDTDDHEPITVESLDQPYTPGRGYWVVTQLDGSHIRAVAPEVFASDYELV